MCYAIAHTEEYSYSTPGVNQRPESTRSQTAWKSLSSAAYQKSVTSLACAEYRFHIDAFWEVRKWQVWLYTVLLVFVHIRRPLTSHSLRSC